MGGAWTFGACSEYSNLSCCAGKTLMPLPIIRRPALPCVLIEGLAFLVMLYIGGGLRLFVIIGGKGYRRSSTAIYSCRKGAPIPRGLFVLESAVHTCLVQLASGLLSIWQRVQQRWTHEVTGAPDCSHRSCSEPKMNAHQTSDES